MLRIEPFPRLVSLWAYETFAGLILDKLIRNGFDISYGNKKAERKGKKMLNQELEVSLRVMSENLIGALQQAAESTKAFSVAMCDNAEILEASRLLAELNVSFPEEIEVEVT